MKTFTELSFELLEASNSVETASELTESRSLLRKGAVTAFTMKSRAHAKSAQASLQRSLTVIKGSKGKSSPEQVEALCDALEAAVEGLIEITKQINQTTAVSASAALLNERTDQQILDLLKRGSSRGR